MPSHKDLNKTEKVLKYLIRYKSITRNRAAYLFDVWHLSGIIHIIRQSGAFEIEIETVKGSSPNTKYRLVTKSVKEK